MADQQTKYSKPWKIPFEDNGYQLTTEELDKYAAKEIVNRKDWYWPSLKFISYTNGTLTLQNNHKKSVYLLTLQVEGHQLQENLLNSKAILRQW